ncbi:MAG: HD domain-containing protein [Candidatus Jorgensenbacteria bacterium]
MCYSKNSKSKIKERRYPLETKKIVWELFPKLTEKVWSDHASAGMLGGSHDPDHAIRVAQMALVIADDPNIGRLAAAAGLCHNADRIIKKKTGTDIHKVPDEDVRELVEEELSSEGLGSEESAIIIGAVLGHKGKNGAGDHPVLITLMDADRLVNAEPDLIMRSGQHYHELPPVDPIHLWEDPEADYWHPKTVLRDVMETIVWLTPGDDNPLYVRLPKARVIAAERKKFFDNFAATLVQCREETGFHPYPADLLSLRKKFMG